MLPFREVDAAFAWDEGEGDRSLDYWRDAHIGFFIRMCAARGELFGEEMETVLERFAMVWPTAGPDAGGLHDPQPFDADVAVTTILVVTDASRSRDFWVDVLGAELYREYGGTSVVLQFCGTWVLLVTGGGPTADKPDVTFAAPDDPTRVSHAMTLRVPSCQESYERLLARGATFLTPPHDWGAEIRCFLRDPDGHLVELSQAT